MKVADAKDTAGSRLCTSVRDLKTQIKSALKEALLFESFLPDLLDNNDAISMMLLSFLVGSKTYVPNLAVSFLNWPIPTVILEFDHKGCRKRNLLLALFRRTKEPLTIVFIF